MLEDNWFDKFEKVSLLLGKSNLTVEERNYIQSSHIVHPYTCGNNRTDEIHTKYKIEHGGDYGQLIATEEGWVCPACGYTQRFN